MFTLSKQKERLGVNNWSHCLFYFYVPLFSCFLFSLGSTRKLLANRQAQGPASWKKKDFASTSAEKFSEPEFSDTIQRWKLFYQGLWSFSCLQTPESLSRALVYCHRIACFAKTFASTILLSWAPSKQNAHSQKPTAFSTHCCDYAHRGELQTRWEKGLIHRTGMALNLNRLSCSGLLFGWKLLLLPFLVFQRCCPAGWDCWEVPGVGTLHAISVSSRTELGLHGFWVLDHRFPWCWGVIRGNILTLRLQLLDAVLSSPVPTSNCVLVSAEQPVVEFTITNAACPLNEWEEAPWHNKSTRERAQMRLHSHKLPLYYTWSAFTIGSSKYDEERG